MDFGLKYEWTKSASKILQHTANLIDNVPAMMFLRHSQREEPEKRLDIRDIRSSPELISQLHKAVLTEEGKLAATDFGRALPDTRKFRIFHSPFVRCVETAQYMFKGINHHTSDVEMKGEMVELFDMQCDETKKNEYIRRDGLQYFENWISGRYPPSAMPPLFNYAKQVEEKLKEIAQSSTPNTLDIFISHDVHIFVLLFYWATIIPLNEWIDYLDGFILQLIDDKMLFYYKGGKKKIYLPYWW